MARTDLEIKWNQTLIIQWLLSDKTKTEVCSRSFCHCGTLTYIDTSLIRPYEYFTCHFTCKNSISFVKMFLFHMWNLICESKFHTWILYFTCETHVSFTNIWNMKSLTKSLFIYELGISYKKRFWFHIWNENFIIMWKCSNSVYFSHVKTNKIFVWGSSYQM